MMTTSASHPAFSKLIPLLVELFTKWSNDLSHLPRDSSSFLFQEHFDHFFSDEERFFLGSQLADSLLSFSMDHHLPFLYYASPIAEYGNEVIEETWAFGFHSNPAFAWDDIQQFTERLWRQNPDFQLFLHLPFPTSEDLHHPQYQFRSSLWSSFQPYRFNFPSFIIKRKNHDLHCQFQWIESSLLSALEIFQIHSPFFNSHQSVKKQSLVRFESPQWVPSTERWLSKEKDLRSFFQEPDDKVVLSRSLILNKASSLSAAEYLLSRLKTLQSSSIPPHCTVYAFVVSEEDAFLSFSPEKLFFRLQQQLWIDCLAGTQKTLQQDLFTSSKDRLEHRIVHDFIQSQLQQKCLNFQWHPLRLMTLHHLQHLYTLFEGTLLNTTPHWDLIKTLHPTPALGGAPKDRALKSISSWENWERGLFGGIIGLLNGHEAQTLVGIRSGLFRQSKLHLFAGAGIVASSDWSEEWKEMERKILFFLGLLGVPYESQ
jgi:menaquinone-specific isochorismate synthase